MAPVPVVKVRYPYPDGTDWAYINEGEFLAHPDDYRLYDEAEIAAEQAQGAGRGGMRPLDEEAEEAAAGGPEAEGGQDPLMAE